MMLSQREIGGGFPSVDLLSESCVGRRSMGGMEAL